MASDFKLTVNKIVEKALRRLGVYAEGDEMTDDMYNSAIDDLNLINASLNKYKKKIWTVEEFAFNLSISNSVTNDDETYICIKNHTSATDNEPGTGSSWRQYWIVGQTTEDATAWALDTDYDNGATIELEENILSVENCYISQDGTDTDVEIINRFKEAEIPEKGETGLPTKLHFERYADTPTIKVYPLPDANEYTLYVSTVRMLDDIGAQGSNPDIPSEWLDFFIFALMYKQSFEWGINTEAQLVYKQEAAAQLQSNIKDQAESSDMTFCRSTY